MYRTALIVEDESVAAQNLRLLLSQVQPGLSLLPTLQSIEETVEFFQSGAAMPDVVFMDIHLADGQAFHIFDQVSIRCPVVFTTAYDQYALQAFRANGIDYLLKPISKEDLLHAFEKLNLLAAGSATPDPAAAARLLEMLARTAHTYQSCFLIPDRDRLIPVAADSIACIFLVSKNSVLLTLDGRRHPLDKPLDLLEERLNPDNFFRANRQYIVSRQAVKEISIWMLGKLSLKLCVDTPDRIVVSKARVSEFKEWFTRCPRPAAPTH